MTPNSFTIIISISTQNGLAEVIQGDTFSPLFFFSLMESMVRREELQDTPTRLGKDMGKEVDRNYMTGMSRLAVS